MESDKERWLELIKLEKNAGLAKVNHQTNSKLAESEGYAITDLAIMEFHMDDNPFMLLGRKAPFKFIAKEKEKYLDREIYSRLAIKDRVGIFKDEPIISSVNRIGTGTLMDSDSDSKEIKISIKKKNLKCFADLVKRCEEGKGSKLIIVKAPNDPTYLRCKEAINSVFPITEESPYCHKVLVGMEKPQFIANPIDKSLLNPKLNEYQIKVIEEALNSRDVYLIHGPPGTGKTFTLAYYIAQVIKSYHRN